MTVDRYRLNDVLTAFAVQEANIELPDEQMDALMDDIVHYVGNVLDAVIAKGN